MDPRDDSSRSVPPIPSTVDPGKLWMLGLALERDGSVTGPGLRRYSFWAECECPDDCTRDHENE